jgi:hypothetical protein
MSRPAASRRRYPVPSHDRQSGERRSACDLLAIKGVRASEAALMAEHDIDIAAWRNRHALGDSERRRVLGEKEAD